MKLLTFFIPLIAAIGFFKYVYAYLLKAAEPFEDMLIETKDIEEPMSPQRARNFLFKLMSLRPHDEKLETFEQNDDGFVGKTKDSKGYLRTFYLVKKEVVDEEQH